jgi:hypothetical protein
MSFDAQTDEHAFDTLGRITSIPDALKPIAAAGIIHAGLAVLAEHLGHALTTEILRDAQRQLDGWRDDGEISP